MSSFFRQKLARLLLVPTVVHSSSQQQIGSLTPLTFAHLFGMSSEQRPLSAGYLRSSAPSAVHHQPSFEMSIDNFLPNKFGYRVDGKIQAKKVPKNLLDRYLSALLLEQTTLHTTEKSLFDFAMDGSIDLINAGLDAALRGDSPVSLANPIEDSIDAMGANLVHVAFMYENYEVGEFLVKKFPEAASKGYVHVLSKAISLPNGSAFPKKLEAFVGYELPYAGVTILHLVALRTSNEQSDAQTEEGKKSNVEVARFLLNFFESQRNLSKILSSLAHGSFFDTTPIFGQYYGGLPFQFAVGSNNREMVEVFLAKIRNVDNSIEFDHLFAKDHYGNNVLHVCVMNELSDMYQYLVEQAYEVIRLKLERRFKIHDKMSTYTDFEEKINQVEKVLLRHYLTEVRNHDGHTPFTLAAAKGSKLMFEFILRFQMQWVKNKAKPEGGIEHETYKQGSRSQLRWRVGSLSCYLISLDGLDVPHERSQESFLADKETLALFQALTGGHNDDALIKVPGVDHARRLYSDNTPFQGEPALRSALEHIARGGEECLGLLGIPEVKHCVNAKWKAYGEKRLRRSEIIAFCFAVVLTYSAITTYASDNGYVAGYIVSLILFGALLMEELLVVVRSPHKYFSREFLPMGAGLYKRICIWLLVVLLIMGVVASVADFGAVSQSQDLPETLPSNSPNGQNDAKVFAVAVSLPVAWLYMFFYMLGREVILILLHYQ